MQTYQPENALELFKKEEYAEYFEFDKFVSKMKSLIGDWSQEITKTDTRRQLRLIEVDVDSMRESNELQSDETFIPMRVIDDNIRKEQPAYVAFLTQANKLISMTDKVDPVNTRSEKLEIEFTKGMKYHGWELPWYREFDGAQLHGWDAVEVVYDQSKPMNCAIEHVGHDRLMFHSDIQDIQNAPFLLRAYSMTSVQLKKMVTDFGFDQHQVAMLLETLRTNSKVTDIKVYKAFLKWEGIVYVAWLEGLHTDDWLKAPQPFYNGVRKEGKDALGQPTWSKEVETMYPIFVLRYNESENLTLQACKGRAFMDCHKQEAQTAIVTGAVNSLVRASNVYASPKNPQGSGLVKYQSDMKIEHGRMFTEPVDFFHTDWPDMGAILGALQYFDAKNANEIGQLTDQLRRKKGEKTATEYESAKQDTALLSTVQMTLLSAHIREVYSYAWRIVQSQAQQGLIALLMIDMIPMPDGSTTYQNDRSLIDRTYEVRAAGDIEVVLRQQRIDKMMQMWGVIANTALAQQFLMDLVKLTFPEQAQKYETILQQGDMGKQLVNALSNMLGEMLKKYPQELETAPPEVRQQLDAINQQTQAYLAPVQQ